MGYKITINFADVQVKIIIKVFFLLLLTYFVKINETPSRQIHKIIKKTNKYLHNQKKCCNFAVQ